MPSLCLYFRIHIPYRLQPFVKCHKHRSSHCMENAEDSLLVNKLSDECYLPANKLLLSLIKQYKGNFKLVFSISGTAMELLQLYRPDVINSFQELVNTNCVDFLAETYYNSLSWLHSKREFRRQVEMHHNKVQELFECSPVLFRNTEFVYSNDLARFISEIGYKGILCEGLDSILNVRTNNQLYAAPGNGDFSIFLRNSSLSDDIAFRFDDKNWNEHPLTAEKFAEWMHAHDAATCAINIHFDYETIGIHKKSTTGIFDFLKNLPGAILENKNWSFKLPADIIESCYPKDVFDSPHTISWQNKTEENCIWSENVMQHNSLQKVYSIENLVKKTNCSETLDYWGKLQSADHFYHMSSLDCNRINSPCKHNPFPSSGEAYLYYKELLTDFELYLIKSGLETLKSEQVYKGAFNLYSNIN